MNINNEQFALFYSIPNWVNVPMGFLGGFLVDKYLGINWGAIICCCFTITGQSLFGFGMLGGNYYIMLVGRFLFGVGGEVLVITNNLRAVKWFHGKELNMVFGLQLSVARAGGTLCINSLEQIFNIFDKSMNGRTKTGLTLMIGSITVIIDLLIAILLFFREKCAESNKKDDYLMDKETMRFSDVFTLKFNFWLVILVIMFYFVSIFTFIAFGM